MPSRLMCLPRREDFLFDFAGGDGTAIQRVATLPACGLG